MEERSFRDGGSQGKWLGVLTAVVAVIMCVYQFLSTRFMIVDVDQHHNIHLALSLILVYLTVSKKWKKFRLPIVMAVFALTLASAVYVHLFYFDMQSHGYDLPLHEIVLSITLLALIFIGSHLAFGKIMPVLALASILYLWFGRLLSPPFTAPSVNFPELMSMLVTGMEGIYGSILGISADYIFLFVLFGSLLQVSGATRFFIQISRLVGRRMRSGAAMSAVISSSLMGTVTGSISANILTVGSFTIPLMKKVGYKPYQAAAIEATASTGGQIMPPVMGAAAFVMSGITMIPYVKICAAAAIPAIMYYLSMGIYVALHARKLNIPPMTEELDKRELLLAAPLFVVPLGTLMFLLVRHYSLPFSIFWAIIILIALSMIFRFKASFRDWIGAMIDGAVTGAQIGVICALLGIIVKVLVYSGLALVLPGIAEAWCGGNLTIALILTMIVATILGCGMPAVPVYVITAMVTAPVLIKMNSTVMQAHLFSFYYGCLAFITPPVAVGALVAAKVAGAKFLQTGMEAVKVCIGGFIIPFLFFYTPIILLQPKNFIFEVFGLAATLIMLLSIQIGLCNYFIRELSLLERILAFIVSLSIFLGLAISSYSTLSLGGAIFVILLISQLGTRAKLVVSARR